MKLFGIHQKEKWNEITSVQGNKKAICEIVLKL